MNAYTCTNTGIERGVSSICGFILCLREIEISDLIDWEYQPKFLKVTN